MIKGHGSLLVKPGCVGSEVLLGKAIIMINSVLLAMLREPYSPRN